MITLTRLSGSQFVLNADLIERVESSPDTVICLVDGKKYVVAESVAQVIEAVREHRTRLIVASASRADEGRSRSTLATVTDLAAALPGPEGTRRS